MPANYHRARSYLNRLLQKHSLSELQRRLEPRHENPAPKVPGGCRWTKETLEQRWQLVQTATCGREALLDPQTLAQMEDYRHHVENFIGSVKLPLGLAGPLRVNGLFAHGDYYIPLATT